MGKNEKRTHSRGSQGDGWQGYGIEGFRILDSLTTLLGEELGGDEVAEDGGAVGTNTGTLATDG